MVRPAVLAAGAAPAIVASLFAASLLAQPEIPSTASVPGDELGIEYTRHHIRTVSFGATERAGAERTESLRIAPGGRAEYTVIEGGVQAEEHAWQVAGPRMAKIAALVKETGFTSIQQGSFPVRDGEAEYARSTVEVTLNGRDSRLSWPEQAATDALVPPIVAAVEAELLHAVGNRTE